MESPARYPPNTNLGLDLHRLLTQYSDTCANNWTVLFLQHHPGWRFGPLPNVDQQIEEINWYWRINLGLVDADTRNERAALISHIDPNVWLSNFERYIIQCVIDHQLPIITWSTKYV